jgi:hypothetical protein
MTNGRDLAINFPCIILIPYCEYSLEIPWLSKDKVNRKAQLLYLRLPRHTSSCASVRYISDIVHYAEAVYQIRAFDQVLDSLQPRSKQTGNPGLGWSPSESFGMCLTNLDSDHKLYVRLLITQPETQDPWLPEPPEPNVDWVLTPDKTWNNNFLVKMAVENTPARREIIAKTLLTMACKKLHLKIREPFDPFEL